MKTVHFETKLNNNKIMNPLCSLFVLALFMSTSHAAETNRPAARPVNVLFIITDQQRWDAMSCAGNPVLKTPNLDQLARQGARFTSFYSACPVCVPARSCTRRPSRA